jgi:hypothetical protein
MAVDVSLAGRQPRTFRRWGVVPQGGGGAVEVDFSVLPDGDMSSIPGFTYFPEPCFDPLEDEVARIDTGLLTYNAPASQSTQDGSVIQDFPGLNTSVLRLAEASSDTSVLPLMASGPVVRMTPVTIPDLCGPGLDSTFASGYMGLWQAIGNAITFPAGTKTAHIFRQLPNGGGGTIASVNLGPLDFQVGDLFALDVLDEAGDVRLNFRWEREGVFDTTILTFLDASADKIVTGDGIGWGAGGIVGNILAPGETKYVQWLGL